MLAIFYIYDEYFVFITILLVYWKKSAYLHFFLTFLIVALTFINKTLTFTTVVLVTINAGVSVRVKVAARVAVSSAFIASVKLCHTSLRLGLQNLRRQVSVTATHSRYESDASVKRRIRIRIRSHRVIVWVEARSNTYCRKSISIFFGFCEKIEIIKKVKNPRTGIKLSLDNFWVGFINFVMTGVAFIFGFFVFFIFAFFWCE